MNKDLFKATIKKGRYPVRLSLSSGEEFVVRHPENIVVNEANGWGTVVAIFEGPRGIYILEPQDIVTVSPFRRRNGSHR